MLRALGKFIRALFFPKQCVYVNVQYNIELPEASQFFEVEWSYALIHSAKYSS